MPDGIGHIVLRNAGCSHQLTEQAGDAGHLLVRLTAV
jgi:hypothetical protein